MLKKIKLIQGVGTFSKTTPGGIDLGVVTIIYGENRNGKSTLCDVMQSLAENDNGYVLNRKSIPSNQATPPKIELMFTAETGNVIATFENEQWQKRNPECSKLHVFDQSFIHRNVITGQKPERSNSESMTSFILGESNIALFTALAEMKNELREKRGLLSNIENQLSTHSIGNVNEYINSPLPVETKEHLETKKAEYQTRIHQIKTTIQNIDNIKLRNVLSAVGKKVNYDQVCESINSVLAANIQNVHQASLLTLQNHINNHVNNSAAFKGWVSQGVSQIKDNCPFCGQTLSEDAKNLISAYQQAFNAEFDRFNETTKQRLNGLRQPFNIPNTRESLIQQHQANKQLFQLYVEPQITTNPDVALLVNSLDQCHEAILITFDTLSLRSQQATEFWSPRLERKFATPYEPAELVSFDALKNSSAAYNQAIYNYWVVAAKINQIFDNYKETLNEQHLKNQLIEMWQHENQVDLTLKRIGLEPLCIQYRQKFQEVNHLQADYHSKKERLDQSNAKYLDKYFDGINQLFRELGSSDFEIIKVPNNRGMQVVYDLRIKFKGEDIPPDRINTVFSESDRRALALCIFLTKVICLSPEEQAKSILIMDDPVTSFDNERIDLILIKLGELQQSIKQLIITTHYKSMAAKVAKKFKPYAKGLKLANGNRTCEIESFEVGEMIASDHDMAFDRINGFVNRQTNDDIRTSLRPFLESEIRFRFKKQLVDLGKTSLSSRRTEQHQQLTSSDLSPCIKALKDNGHIESAIATRLCSIVDSLNTPMHEIGGDLVENTRSLAEQILNIVYSDLNRQSDLVIKQGHHTNS
jgi:wobble nucleotide-excising tRNase